MNEYFELLHKGCNHTGIFLVDVVVFLVLVLIVYSVAFMIKHKVLTELIKMIRSNVQRGRRLNKNRGKAKAANQRTYGQSRNKFAQNTNNNLSEFVVIDAIAKEDEQCWNDFNERY